MSDLHSITLAGAYGESYGDAKSVLVSLNNGCDFRITATYPHSRDVNRVTSIRDLSGIPEIRVRYRNDTLCSHIKVRHSPDAHPHANGLVAYI